MNTTEIINCVLLIGTVGCLLRYSTHHFPETYLRFSDVITWRMHALVLGFAFGIGMIVGRYGFSEQGLEPLSTGLHVALLTLLYLGALLYHERLCANALFRRDDALSEAEPDLTSVLA